MALTKISDVFQLPETLKEIELSVSDLNSSVLGISQEVEDLELSVSQLSSSVLAISGDVNNLKTDVNNLKTKFNIYGYLPCFVTSGKTIILSFPLQGDVNYNHLELSKLSGITVDIYGDKAAIATTFSIASSSISNKIVYIVGNIPEDIETYVTLNRIQCIFIKETIIATLSNAT